MNKFLIIMVLAMSGASSSLFPSFLNNFPTFSLLHVPRIRTTGIGGKPEGTRREPGTVELGTRRFHKSQVQIWLESQTSGDITPQFLQVLGPVKMEQ